MRGEAAADRLPLATLQLSCCQQNRAALEKFASTSRCGVPTNQIHFLACGPVCLQVCQQGRLCQHPQGIRALPGIQEGSAAAALRGGVGWAELLRDQSRVHVTTSLPLGWVERQGLLVYSELTVNIGREHIHTLPGQDSITVQQIRVEQLGAAPGTLHAALPKKTPPALV